MRQIKWIMLGTLALLFTFTSAVAQTTADTFILTLKRAFERWMVEGSGRYYVNVDINHDPDIRFGQFAEGPDSPCYTFTAELWIKNYDDKDYLMERAVIYNCTSRQKALEVYQSYKTLYQASDLSELFHGFSIQFYFIEESSMGSRMWIADNLVFAAEDSGKMGMTLMEVLSPGKGLEEFLYEEAVNNGLLPAENEQSGQSQAAAAELIVQAALHPNPASIEDREIVFSADVYGQTPAEVNTFTYTWYLDGQILCQEKKAPGLCAWMKPTAGNHAVQVTVTSSASKRTASSGIGFEVLEHRAESRDDPDIDAGFIINMLNCTSGITSDDTLSCTLAFQRTDPDVKELAVVWKVDGYTAASMTRTDDGAVFALDKPAPGDHTIQVVVTDPRNGNARSQTDAVEIFEGRNANLPPGAQTGAAIGTLTGIGAMIWWQYFSKRRVGYRKPVPAAAPEAPAQPDDKTTEEDADQERQEEDTGQKGADETKKETPKRSPGGQEETEEDTKKEKEQELSSKGEEQESQEQLKEFYDSAKLGDFFLGGSLPGVDNPPKHAPPTWAPDSPLWKGLNPQMTDEEFAQFLKDLRRKYKITDAALTGLRAYRAAVRTLMTAEQWVGSAWRWATGASDGEWDIIVPDPVSSFHENLIKNSEAEAALDQLKEKCWDSQSGWENVYYGKNWTREEAEGLLADYQQSLDSFDPDDFSNSDDAVEAYDALKEKVNRFKDLLAHPEFI